MSKKFLLLFFLCFCSSLVFSHGKNDIEERDVENFNSWQEIFDLEQKKPVKTEQIKVNTDGEKLAVGQLYELIKDFLEREGITI